MAAGRQWVKLWDSWFTSVSHGKVGPEPLLVGVALMTFIRWTPGDASAWATLEDGQPVPLAVIAERAQLGAKRCEAALRILKQRGTVGQRQDGAWGFPKFGRWQETPNAAKKRRLRARGPGQSRALEEAEAEGEADQLAFVATPPEAKPRPRTVDDDALVVLERIEHCRRELGADPLPAARRDLRNVLRVLEDHPVRDLIDVVSLRAREVRADPSKAKYFDTISPFSGRNPNGQPGGWVTSLRMLDEHRSRSKPRPGPGSNGHGTGALAEQRRVLDISPEESAAADRIAAEYLARTRPREDAPS